MSDRLMGLWQEPFGDRRQEIVLIGRELDESLVREVLDGALVTDEELDAGPREWANYVDTLPKWIIEDSTFEYDEDSARRHAESELSDWQEFR